MRSQSSTTSRSPAGVFHSTRRSTKKLEPARHRSPFVSNSSRCNLLARACLVVLGKGVDLASAL